MTGYQHIFHGAKTTIQTHPPCIPYNIALMPTQSRPVGLTLNFGGARMKKQVRKQDVQKLIGKQIYAIKKDGTIVEGKLIRVSGNQMFIAPRKGKQVKTSAILPLVLFDLL